MLLSGKLRHKWSKKMSTKEENVTVQPPNHCAISQADYSSQAPQHSQSPFLWEVLLEPWVKDPLSGPVVPLS